MSKTPGVGQGVGAARQRFGRTRVAKVQLGRLQLNDVEFAVTSFADAPQVFPVQPVWTASSAERYLNAWW
jgi:hypothetical protein